MLVRVLTDFEFSSHDTPEITTEIIGYYSSSLVLVVDSTVNSNCIACRIGKIYSYKLHFQ